ncbi:phosphatases II [Cylindrobasidium torrendii FP15055 ss-10]|uniref:protein-tyrosine-phosphatase n=1 Tax=Cylindrobasidium torrendii FP15055 ss-10 TaxID=1314674 RepID=A0A0D7B8S6_9AGAR|nr:phosphatases II [Cylindrobasidium torrendii FP15055 ss-10]
MDEILPGLWIGDLSSAKNVELLRENKIFSILSAMRGSIMINQAFVKNQLLIDDEEDADIMVHFLPAITFIQTELDKGRGVLVHCHAGMSRSATIVAAYLMYTGGLTVEQSLAQIREKRPQIEPNPGFLLQLELFHKSSFRISQRDKDTRLFYLERTTERVMNGDGSLPETANMFAPTPNTPGGSGTHRRIRCKMCRQELAAREHMLDHGQLGPATPAGTTPTSSRRPSMKMEYARTTSGSETRPRRPSGLSNVMNVGALSLEDKGHDEAVEDEETEGATIDAAKTLGRRLSNALDEPAKDTAGPKHFTSPQELAAQLSANPKLAALRNGISMTPAHSSNATSVKLESIVSPPIIANPKCSGYFVEAMKWMEPFLHNGEMAGKILCPNKKCNAKLGNFDWAGVCCGCKTWVTPGFCINRSKVDEVVVAHP